MGNARGQQSMREDWPRGSGQAYSRLGVAWRVAASVRMGLSEYSQCHTWGSCRIEPNTGAPSEARGNPSLNVGGTVLNVWMVKQESDILNQSLWQLWRHLLNHCWSESATCHVSVNRDHGRTDVAHNYTAICHVECWTCYGISLWAYKGTYICWMVYRWMHGIHNSTPLRHYLRTHPRVSNL